jgi:hypothetical protein
MASGGRRHDDRLIGATMGTMFQNRKLRKHFKDLHQKALGEGLNELADHVRTDSKGVLFGDEKVLADEAVLITGPAGVESGEHDVQHWGWMVLTTKRANFERLDGDRVRVAFVEDLTLDSSSGPFDNYLWQDKAQLRRISFGFLEDSGARAELARVAGG